MKSVKMWMGIASVRICIKTKKTSKTGPVWDFWYRVPVTRIIVEVMTPPVAWVSSSQTGDGYQPPFWWQRMMVIHYTNQLKCRWQNLRATVLDKQHIYSIIDSIREYSQWKARIGILLCGRYLELMCTNPSPYPTTYAGEIQNLEKSG